MLGPRQLGLLAAVGRASVRVRARARGSWSCRPAPSCASPGRPLGHDSIYDGNSYLLAAAARHAGAIAYRVGHRLRRRRARSSTRSATSSSAPTSWSPAAASRKGDYDVVKEALAPLGHGRGSAGSRCSPGKPQGFGVVGEDETPIFTLPGNPVSSYVSFEMFVLPAIRTDDGPDAVRAARRSGRVLTHGAALARGPPAVRPRHASTSTAAARTSTPVGGHGSHLIGDLAEANALIVVPEPTSPRSTPASRSRCSLLDRGLLDGRRSEPRLTHVDESGAARMVDVSGKDVTAREAVATGRVLVSAEVVGAAARRGRAQGRRARRSPGSPGSWAPSRRPTWSRCATRWRSPAVTVDLAVADDAVEITATVRTTDRTGVEMEALTAVVGRRADRRRHGQGRRQGAP